jgi:hypothetical protein
MRHKMLSSRSPTLRTGVRANSPNPINHGEPLADRVAALERTVRRLEHAHASSTPAPVDSRSEAILTLLSLLLRMLHSGPFDLHAYRAQVTAVAEFFEDTSGSPGSHAGADCASLSARDEAAELCRQLLASIEPKTPRPRPQLRLVSSTDEPAAPPSYDTL